MSLSQKIQGDLKTAMLNKDQTALRGLRAIKSAIILAQTEKGASSELTTEQEIQMLQKLVKQRKDSLEIFEKQNRDDLAQKEREEIEVIGKYLPQQMSEAELKVLIEKTIDQTGAEGIKDMGKVMGQLTKQLAGKADNKTVAVMVRSLLS